MFRVIDICIQFFHGAENGIDAYMVYITLIQVIADSGFLDFWNNGFKVFCFLTKLADCLLTVFISSLF